MPAPGRFKYKQLGSYARLRSEDVAVWNQFITETPHSEWRVDYDVKVGLGRIPKKELEDKYKKDWRDLTRKRIDVVAWGENHVYIIELKPRASLAAVGQALGYSELWQDLHDEGRRVLPVVLSFYTDPDTDVFAKAAGVAIWTVKKSFRR